MIGPGKARYVRAMTDRPDRSQSAGDHEALAQRPMDPAAPPDPVTVHEPVPPAAPLVLDVPHSGRHYPEDFGHAAGLELLMGGEDRFVDRLFAGASSEGARLVVANFARTYIDPNRRLSDIDTALLDGDWHGELDPSEMSARGVGLVFRLIGDGTAIYDGKLTAAEIMRRIETYWRPYHERLEEVLQQTRKAHGAVYHLDCHSMQPVGNDLAPDPGRARADMVLGDLDGTSCEAGFTRHAAETLEGLGYSIAINDPYKGAYIVERHGDPAGGVHSLQLEINRKLYLDPETLEPGPGFAALAEDITRLCAALAAYARGKSAA